MLETSQVKRLKEPFLERGGLCTSPPLKDTIRCHGTPEPQAVRRQGSDLTLIAAAGVLDFSGPPPFQ